MKICNVHPHFHRAFKFSPILPIFIEIFIIRSLSDIERTAAYNSPDHDIALSYRLVSGDKTSPSILGGVGEKKRKRDTLVPRVLMIFKQGLQIRLPSVRGRNVM